MGQVIRFVRRRSHARASTGYRSGRNSLGAIPVKLEIDRTRSAGTLPSSQRRAVDLLTPKAEANASSVIPLPVRNERIGLVDMQPQLHKTQLHVKAKVAFDAGDRRMSAGLALRMPKPAKIHTDKSPPRLHYIVEWAKKRGIKPKDIVENLGVNKSTVSRWFEGTVPMEAHLVPLAAYFQLEKPADLFTDPDEDWMTRLLRGRSKDEIERIKTMIEVAFPQKKSNAA